MFGTSGDGGGAPALAPRQPETVVPSPQVAELRRTLTGLATVDPVELPAGLALVDTRELLAARAQLDAVLLRRLGDVDARKLHQLDSSPTVTSWVRAQDATVDAGTVTLARRLIRLPGVDGAVRTGRLSPDAAARVAAALTRLRPLVDRPDGLIDGQPGEQVVTAVVMDGVSGAVFAAHAGLDDDDPRVDALLAALSEISCSPTSQSPGWRRGSCCSPSTCRTGRCPAR